MTRPTTPLVRRVALAVLAALPMLGAVWFVEGSESQPVQVPLHLVASTKQTATLLMHPQLAQPGSGVASPDAAKSSMTARFTPIREGRKVVLQKRKGTSWVSIATRAENGRGIAEFSAPYRVNGVLQSYRAVAAKTSTLAQIATVGVRVDRWGAADFTDGFTGDALGSSWSHRLQGYSAESKRACSKSDPRAVKVLNGAVRLSVLKDPDRTDTKCTNPHDGKQYAWRINGHIGTDGMQAFRYGYAAARVKFQPRAGQHASFWLQPQTQDADQGSAQGTGAEIDVIEWFGNRTNDDVELTSFIYHYPDGEPVKVGGFVKNSARFGSDWAGKYHVFSVEWTPSYYVFRIDGQQTLRISQGVSGQPEYFILSLLSSDYELPLLGGDDKLPQHMYVDWVRFWKR